MNVCPYTARHLCRFFQYSRLVIPSGHLVYRRKPCNRGVEILVWSKHLQRTTSGPTSTRGICSCAGHENSHETGECRLSVAHAPTPLPKQQQAPRPRRKAHPPSMPATRTRVIHSASHPTLPDAPCLPNCPERLRAVQKDAIGKTVQLGWRTMRIDPRSWRHEPPQKRDAGQLARYLPIG
jgi:hypothetical protein